MPLLARSHQCKARTLLALVCIAFVFVLGLVSLRSIFPIEYRETILEWSAAYNLDPAWVASIIRFESRFMPDAVSSAGATGLMQIMPATGTWIAEQHRPPLDAPIDLNDPLTNIRLGTWYLRYLLDRFESRDVALMAYNAGPSNAVQWEGSLELAFPETQQYIRRVQLALPVYRLYLKVPWLIDLIPSVHF